MITELANKLFAGNLLFAACCVAYLFWWSVAFRPGYTAPGALKFGLFFITAALGVAGLSIIIQGCRLAGAGAQEGSQPGTHYLGIIAASAAAYIILLLLTNLLMHRQVTTELMLIVFWACMEVCACNALFGTGAISAKAFGILVAIVLVAAIASMICYLKYYDLEPMPAFYDGMVPLILFALVMIGIAMFIRFGVKM